MTWLHGLDAASPKMRLAALKWSALHAKRVWVYMPPRRREAMGTWVKLPMPPMEWRHKL